MEYEIEVCVRCGGMVTREYNNSLGDYEPWVDEGCVYAVDGGWNIPADSGDCFNSLGGKSKTIIVVPKEDG